MPIESFVRYESIAILVGLVFWVPLSRRVLVVVGRLAGPALEVAARAGEPPPVALGHDVADV